MATILLYEKVPAAWFEAFGGFLRAHQPEGLGLELAQLEDSDREKADDLLRRANVLVSGLLGPGRALGGEVFAKAPELRLVQIVGSRAVGVDLAAARDARVQVSLLPAPAHVACAEHTILLVLALAKKLILAHQKVVKRSMKEAWPEPRPATRSDYAYNWAGIQGIGLVAGRALGLVGIGDIAIEVARRARALGMRLLYCDKAPLPPDEERELGLERRELDVLLGEADVVSLHVGLTPETEKLINAERLALMKPTAFLVNTARGGLVDEAALADALTKGRLAGAALDVWAEEPTPRDNPLLRLDTVIATPHIGAAALPKTALFEAILPNVLAALKGEGVLGSLTQGMEPKPAVPFEAPPPPIEQATSQQPSAPGTAATEPGPKPAATEPSEPPSQPNAT